MARWRNVLLAAALVGALGLFAAACDDGAESQSNAQQSAVDALQASIDETNARVQRNEQMNALLTLGTLSLHQIDEGLTATGTVDPSYSPNTTTAVRVLAMTNWGEHQQQADAARQAGVDLLAALNDEDIEAAKPAAAALHETEHELREAVWASLLAELPEEEGGVAPDDDESGSETPGAADSPEADASGPGNGDAPAAGATP